jgi:putative SOS response-associated peptidase YedK
METRALPPASEPLSSASAGDEDLLAGVMNDRTPVILPPDRIDAWLDPNLTDKHAAQKLISGIEYEPLQFRAVSTAVNKTGRGASKGPELIEPLADHADQPLQLIPA